eukprot:UN01741
MGICKGLHFNCLDSTDILFRSSMKIPEKECYIGDPIYDKKIWDRIMIWTNMRTSETFQGKHQHHASHQWISRSQKNTTFQIGDMICLTSSYIPST